MNKLKEINGKYYQECSIVMLSNDKANDCTGLIQCIKDWESRITPEEDFNKVGDLSYGKNTSQGVFKYWKPQHLYITSNEEIKVEDYFLADNRDNISENNGNPLWVLCKCTKVNNDWLFCNELKEIGLNPDWSKKIIATTDSSISIMGKDYPKLFFDYYPQPSKQFVQKYIEEYNKGNVIDKVLVEYNKNTYEDWTNLPKMSKEEFNTLRIDSHNCITIKPIKTSWSREEIIKLFSELQYDVAQSILNKGKTIIPVDWFKDKLK